MRTRNNQRVSTIHQKSTKTSTCRLLASTSSSNNYCAWVIARLVSLEEWTISKSGREPTKKSDNYEEIGQLVVDHAQNRSKTDPKVVWLSVSPKVPCVEKDHEEFQDEKNLFGSEKNCVIFQTHTCCAMQRERVRTTILYICGVGTLNVSQTLSRARSRRNGSTFGNCTRNARACSEGIDPSPSLLLCV
jgi:hypothetical protein